MSAASFQDRAAGYAHSACTALSGCARSVLGEECNCFGVKWSLEQGGILFLAVAVIVALGFILGDATKITAIVAGSFVAACLLNGLRRSCLKRDQPPNPAIELQQSPAAQVAAIASPAPASAAAAAAPPPAAAVATPEGAV